MAMRHGKHFLSFFSSHDTFLNEDWNPVIEIGCELPSSSKERKLEWKDCS